MTVLSTDQLLNSVIHVTNFTVSKAAEQHEPQWRHRKPKHMQEIQSILQHLLMVQCQQHGDPEQCCYAGEHCLKTMQKGSLRMENPALWYTQQAGASSRCNVHSVPQQYERRRNNGFH